MHKRYSGGAVPVPKPNKPQREDQRIAKLLARAGIASRREIERMIAEGRVALDGVAIETPATLLASLRGVTVDGKPVQAPEAARLFVYHKPTGLLVTERDPKGRPTIYDRLPRDLPRLVPVGRLDLNTEGLLLLTTDGELKRQLELPATGVERTYRARTYGGVTQAQLEELIHGIEIEGVRYGSINANLEQRTGANTWIELTLKEGKNREVRRVLEHLGLQVSRLIRTRYGPFILADMPPGEIGEVRQHEVVAFRKNPTRNEIHVSAQQRAKVEVRPAPPAAPGRTGAPRDPGARRPAAAGKHWRDAPGAAKRTDSPAAAPPRGRGPKQSADRPIAQPARAARAKAHRETREPRPGDLAERPRPSERPRTAGPAGGRGAPRGKPRKPRPPRTRK